MVVMQKLQELLSWNPRILKMINLTTREGGKDKEFQQFFFFQEI
jgi:hypothetical protein